LGSGQFRAVYLSEWFALFYVSPRIIYEELFNPTLELRINCCLPPLIIFYPADCPYHLLKRVFRNDYRLEAYELVLVFRNLDCRRFCDRRVFLPISFFLRIRSRRRMALMADRRLCHNAFYLLCPGGLGKKSEFMK